MCQWGLGGKSLFTVTMIAFQFHTWKDNEHEIWIETTFFWFYVTASLEMIAIDIGNDKKCA